MTLLSGQPTHLASRFIRAAKVMRLRAHRRLRRLMGSEQGATTLEWALLLAGIGLPSYFIMVFLLNILREHYRMITFVNSLPFM